MRVFSVIPSRAALKLSGPGRGITAQLTRGPEHPPPKRPTRCHGGPGRAPIRTDLHPCEAADPKLNLKRLRRPLNQKSAKSMFLRDQFVCAKGDRPIVISTSGCQSVLCLLPLSLIERDSRECSSRRLMNVHHEYTCSARVNKLQSQKQITKAKK